MGDSDTDVILFSINDSITSQNEILGMAKELMSISRRHLSDYKFWKHVLLPNPNINSVNTDNCEGCSSKPCVCIYVLF